VTARDLGPLLFTFCDRFVLPCCVASGVYDRGLAARGRGSFPSQRVFPHNFVCVCLSPGCVSWTGSRCQIFVAFFVCTFFPLSAAFFLEP
jgi:hypothetical protein